MFVFHYVSPNPHLFLFPNSSNVYLFLFPNSSTVYLFLFPNSSTVYLFRVFVSSFSCLYACISQLMLWFVCLSVCLSPPSHICLFALLFLFNLSFPTFFASLSVSSSSCLSVSVSSTSPVSVCFCLSVSLFPCTLFCQSFVCLFVLLFASMSVFS